MEDNFYEAIKLELDQEVLGKDKWLAEIKATVLSASVHIDTIAEHSQCIS
jgi:hypothetical protein